MAWRWWVEIVVVPLVVALAPPVIQQVTDRRGRHRCTGCGAVAPRLTGAELEAHGWAAASELRVLCPQCNPNKERGA